MTTRAPRVILVDGSSSYGATVVQELERSGYAPVFRQVPDADAVARALDEGPWDLVVADYSMPDFKAAPVLALLKTRGWKVPVVVVSSNLGEDVAVAAMRAGAHDYLLKDHVPRLVPTIERALREFADRKRAEEERRAQEAGFRLLFESHPQPMWVFDRSTLRFLEVNEAAIAQYGYSRDEFLGMRIVDIRPEEDVPRLEAALATEGPGIDQSGGWRHRLKDGRLIDVEITSHALEFRGHESELVVAQDVTERRSLESRLLQAQKMEAVGHLAGGIAHDFNNLLSVIAGYCEMALRDMKDGDPNRRRLKQAVRAAQRSADLTRQLLAFSRKQVLLPRVLDMNAVVAGVEEMLRRLIGEHIALKTVLSRAAVRAKADPGQMEQILVNLAVNARDAMPKGGTLIIETSRLDLDEGYLKTHSDAQIGPQVMLAVSDTGHGMDAATRARIFEPFFTTKEKGKGTGLGLATVYGIVKQSGGHIEVYSEEGLGTSFKVYLPRTEEEVEAPPRASGVAQPSTGGETILLVEDEEALRAMLSETLRGAGYVVLEAPKPHDALALMAARGGDVDVVLTDVVMPGMSGREMEARLRADRHRMPVLYMSGYTDEAIDQHGMLEPDAHFINKPFTTAAILDKLRAILRGS